MEKSCLLWNLSLVPKRLATAVIESSYILNDHFQNKLCSMWSIRPLVLAPPTVPVERISYSSTTCFTLTLLLFGKHVRHIFCNSWEFSFLYFFCKTDSLTSFKSLLTYHILRASWPSFLNSTFYDCFPLPCFAFLFKISPLLKYKIVRYLKCALWFDMCIHYERISPSSPPI